MAITLDDLDLDSRKISFSPALDTGRIHANEFDPSGLVMKTHSLVNNISTETTGGASLVGRITSFPHPALEAIQAGLLKEDLINKDLHRHIDKIEEAQADIGLLLDLTAEIGNAKEESKNFSEKAKQILEKLRERGIDLKGETLGEVKRRAGSEQNKRQSEIQILFSTKVQGAMQAQEAMYHILQNFIRQDEALKRHINQQPK